MIIDHCDNMDEDNDDYDNDFDSNTISPDGDDYDNKQQQEKKGK